MLSTEMKERLIAAGLTKNQAASVTAETIVNYLMNEDEKVLIAEARNQVQGMKELVDTLRAEYSILKQKIPNVKDNNNNNIQIFCYKSMPVRTVEINGEIWFVAKDICDILELSDVSMATRNLDDNEKGVSKIYTLKGIQDMTVISEYGVYTLIFKSRKKEGKQFSRWITHDVLPQLRKYSLTDTPNQGKTIMSKEILEAAEKICRKAFSCQSAEDFRDTVALDNIFKSAYGNSALGMAGIILVINRDADFMEETDSDGCVLHTCKQKHYYAWEHKLLPTLPEDIWQSWYDNENDEDE